MLNIYPGTPLLVKIARKCWLMFGHWEVSYSWVWYIYLFLQINIYNTAHGLKIAGPMYKYRNPSKLIKINYFVNGEDNESSTSFLQF